MSTGLSRRFFCPEVVQSSAMDCGPASLASLLQGLGVPASYGRLREACQTDVDGTSIEALQGILMGLGLDAEQVMLPADHLLVPDAVLPALLVVKAATGGAHAVVLWRRQGALFQIMDPALGRRWVTYTRLLDELFFHEEVVPAAAWREWAGEPESRSALRHQLAGLGVGARRAGALLDRALADPSWRALAALDGMVRQVAALVRSGGLRPGREAARTIELLLSRIEAEPGAPVAAPSFPVRPAPAGEDGEERLTCRGIVIVRVRGRKEADLSLLPKEVQAAVSEAPERPLAELFRLLRQDGLLAPGLLLLGMLLGAVGMVVETGLLRGMVDAGRRLGILEQRFTAVAALLCLSQALLLCEWPLVAGLLRLGRSVEVRLRAAFLYKLPRLGDRYFHSRLVSDMAGRAHNAYVARLLAPLGLSTVRPAFELLLTTSAIIWLAPTSAPLALSQLVLVLVLPLLLQAPLSERELRMRAYEGAGWTFHLDALLGLMALRAHGAQPRQLLGHEALLASWVRSGRSFLRVAVLLDVVQAVAGYGLGGAILLSTVEKMPDPGGALLLAYWVLNVPLLGQQLASAARTYPTLRNATMKLCEPLGALEEEGDEVPVDPAAEGEEAPKAAVEVRLEGVSVQAGGHPILADVDLVIAAGSHVAIVGSSGAGKSTLVGLLLGWHRPAAGTVTVDGQPLDGAGVARLRRRTAWLDPAVHLWNRSLFENLGGRDGGGLSFDQVLAEADLGQVVQHLPEGLSSKLGEGGGLVSGGEGQRVRLGRALRQGQVGLAILDEPFRGLDRPKRRELLQRTRARFHGATLLCVTHDVGETQGFDRVLVVEGGRIVEDGAPAELSAREGSRYRALLQAEDAVRSGMWADGEWRRLRLVGGAVRPAGEEP